MISVCKIQGLLLCWSRSFGIQLNIILPVPVRNTSTVSVLSQLLSPVLCALFSPQGKYILTPSPITYAEEQLFHFFGQLLGIAIRADVPLPLDLLPSFWKTLVGEPLDPDVDLQEADILTYNYVKKFENVGPFSLFPLFLKIPSRRTAGGCQVVFMDQGWEMSSFLLDAGFYILLPWRSFPHSPAAGHGGIPASEIFTGIAKPDQSPQSRILLLQ